MSSEPVQEGKTTPGAADTILCADISWSVVHARSDNAIYISSLDYHAGPLRIDRNMAERFLSALAPHGEDSSPAAGPSIRLNRKERCAEVSVGGHVVKLSRKELYWLGKKLGRRAKPDRQS